MDSGTRGGIERDTSDQETNHFRNCPPIAVEATCLCRYSRATPTGCLGQFGLR